MTIHDLLQRYGELPCDCGRVHTTDSERRLCLRAQPGWDGMVQNRLRGRPGGDGDQPRRARQT